MHPPYANTLTIVLVILGAIGCVGRFDYNLVLALGWLYLGQLNQRLAFSIGFYVMVFGSILVDVISIVASSGKFYNIKVKIVIKQGKGGAFTTVLIPILQILVKIGIVLICAMDYFNSKNKDNRYRSMQKRQSMQNQ